MARAAESRRVTRPLTDPHGPLLHELAVVVVQRQTDEDAVRLVLRQFAAEDGFECRGGDTVWHERRVLVPHRLRVRNICVGQCAGMSPDR
jgi:hypothetical protein